MTTHKRPDNANDLVNVPVGTANDGFGHTLRVTAPLPGESYTGTDDADAFPPRQRELYGQNWPADLRWPFALTVTDGDTEPLVRIINTLVPLCWELRQTSYHVHLVAHVARQHIDAHPHAFDLTADVHRHRANIQHRHHLDTQYSTLRQYETALHSLATNTHIELRVSFKKRYSVETIKDCLERARDVCAWVYDCLNAIETVRDAYDNIVQYSGENIHAIHNSDEHVDGLQDAFHTYDDALYDIDLVSVVHTLSEPLHSDTSTGYV